MGRGHGTYDDIILLNEVPDYEARVDKALHEGLKGCVHAMRSFDCGLLS